MTIRILLFSVLLGTSLITSELLASEGVSCESSLVELQDYELTVNKLRRTYQLHRFAELESAIQCLMSKDVRFLSGKPGSVAVYWFYRKEMPGPGADNVDLHRIEAWRSAIPDSDFAHFASLRYLYADAWNARGSNSARNTRRNQFEQFARKLVEAEKAILSSKKGLLDTPISQNLLMAVALDSSSTQSDAGNIFLSGIERWPTYYDFYEVVLTRLVPKWGGSWQVVDDFIKHSSEQREDSEGSSLYARLYYSVHVRGNAPNVTLVDWNLLSVSLESLVKRYPTSTHAIIAASYSCLYGEADQYRKYTNMSMPRQMRDNTAWLPDTSRVECDRKFGQTDAAGNTM